MKIIIYDAHPLMRDGLEHLVLSRGDTVIASTSHAAPLVDAVAAGQADLLIIDPLSLPALALDELRLSALRGNDLRCLVFTATESAAWLLRGASIVLLGCLNKSAGIKAINAVLNGLAASRQAVLPVARSPQEPAERALDEQDLLTILTRRELQILRQLGVGLTNKMIADEMGLSPKTISTYKRNIMHKLKTRNASELIRFAQQHGF